MTAGRAPDGGAAGWHREWAAALDELELSIHDTKRLLATTAPVDEAPLPSAPWQPPTGLGPLPADMRSRAEAILARQRAAAQEIIATLVGNRRHAALAARLETGTSVPGPAYVDRAV